MKKVWIYGYAHFTDGTQKKSRYFVSAAAFSRWANAQFNKDEGVTVEEYAMNKNDYAVIHTCTWHA